MRTVYFSDGSTVSASYISRQNQEENVEIHPGDVCIIEPFNPLNKANGHRGRQCRFLGTGRKIGKIERSARVQFLDEKGGYGYIDPGHLKPYSPEASH